MNLKFHKIEELNQSKFIDPLITFYFKGKDAGIENAVLGVMFDPDYGVGTFQIVVKTAKSPSPPFNIWSGAFGDFTHNCGMLSLSSPYVSPIPGMPKEFYKLILNIVESYAYYVLRKSTLVGSDRFDEAGAYYSFIKKYGEGWEFSKPTQNRNYPQISRPIGIYWKNIGDFTYPTYGFTQR